MVKTHYKLIKINGKIVRKINLKRKSCKPRVFLTSERSAIKGVRNVMKEVNITKSKQISPTRPENIQLASVLKGSETSFYDLRNFITYKKMKKTEEISEKCCIFRDKLTKKTLDFKRENNSSCTTKPTEHENTNLESNVSSFKKYPSLSVTISESFIRKVAILDFDLDATRVDKFVMTENIDDTELEPKKEVYSRNLNIKEEEKTCDPLSKKLTPTLEELNVVKDQEMSNERSELKCKNLVLLIKKEKEINIDRTEIDEDCDSEYDSDGVKKQRPNRRLQAERPVSALQSGNEKLKPSNKRNLYPRQSHGIEKRKRCTSLGKDEEKESDESYCLPHHQKEMKTDSDCINGSETKHNNVVTQKIYKSAELWSEVLPTPKPWKADFNKIDTNKYRHGMVEANYPELLNKFVNFNSVRKLQKNQCLIFWDEKCQEKFQDPNINQLFFSEFYIPPARVELFHQELTEDMSFVECLRKVCENRNWPQPVYQQIPQTNGNAGFVYSCQLKTLQFTPTKPAFNCPLAQELAAETCLDWLGLMPGRAISASLRVSDFETGSHPASRMAT